MRLRNQPDSHAPFPAQTAAVDDVTQQYHALIDSMSIAERVQRSVAMAAWARDWMGRQIVAEQGPMSERRLKILVALRVYRDDPEVVFLLEQLLSDVPD